MRTSKINVGIVAGETSGDILGADLISALKEKYPNINFFGICGPKMQKEGCVKFAPIEALNVMGLIEPLKKLPQILTLRKKIVEFFLNKKISLFIGIDSPEFNLSLEENLRKHGVKTVQYVSPQVWAWRKNRYKKIKRAVNKVLTLFPFEEGFYKEHDIPAKFVGHPMANKIASNIDKTQYREKLKLPADKKIIAILPGSRASTIKYSAPEFIDTVKKINALRDNYHFVVALVNDAGLANFNKYLDGSLSNLQIEVNNTSNVLAAADSALCISGTATLECALYNLPITVAYKMSALTYFIIKRLVYCKYIALPNLILDELVVNEFVQDRCKAELLADDLLTITEDNIKKSAIKAKFNSLHESLKQNSKDLIVNEIIEELGVSF